MIPSLLPIRLVLTMLVVLAAAVGSQAAPAAAAGEVVLAQAAIPLPPPRPDPDSLGTPGGSPLQIQPDRQGEAEQRRLTLRLSAQLTEESGPLPGGVIWRVFRARPRADGSFAEVDRSEEAQPVFLLPEGDYIVHAAYGRASAAQQLQLRGEAKSQSVVLQAGGLRIACVGTGGEKLMGDVSLSIYSSEQDEYGQRKLILDNAPLDRIVRLNPGTYHIVSRYGDANAVVRADVRVQPGKLTEATVTHRAAAVTLKLVNEPGGEALANTAWSILSPGGDIVKESFGAFPVHVLAAGDYAVVARNEGRTYNADFTVQANEDREVEVVAR